MRGTNCFAAFVTYLLSAFLLQSLPGQPQEADLATAKASIQRLKQIPSAVARVQALLRDTSFFGGGISVEYCRTPGLIWGCWDNGRISISIDHANIKQALQSEYEKVSSYSSQSFESSYSPVRSWLVVTLPAFAGKFDAASEQMRLYSEQAKTGTPEQVNAASANMKKAIEEIVKEIRTSETQLNNSFRQLTEFNKGMNRVLGGIDGVRVVMEQNFVQNEAILKVKLPPSAQTEALRQHEMIKTNVRNQFEKVVEAGRQFGVAAAGSDNSIPEILTRIVEIQRRYQSVLERLRKVEISPAGAIQQLRISTTRTAIRNLADYARAELQ